MKFHENFTELILMAHGPISKFMGILCTSDTTKLSIVPMIIVIHGHVTGSDICKPQL